MAGGGASRRFVNPSRECMAPEPIGLACSSEKRLVVSEEKLGWKVLEIMR
jgi:hypothetical protein